MHNFLSNNAVQIKMHQTESDETLFGTNLKSSIRMSLSREEIR